jgi:hypothetical protein
MLNPSFTEPFEENIVPLDKATTGVSVGCIDREAMVDWVFMQVEVMMGREGVREKDQRAVLRSPPTTGRGRVLSLFSWGGGRSAKRRVVRSKAKNEGGEMDVMLRMLC